MDTDIVFGRHGDVYVGSAFNDRFVRFSPEGTWRGVQSFDRLALATIRPGDPAQGDHWINTNLADASGTILLALQRRADGDWLGDRVITSVAPDGSLAVLDGMFPPFDRDKSDPDPTVSLYSRQGMPLRALHLPISPASIAWDGKLLVVGKTDLILAFTAFGEPLWEFHPKLSANYLQPFIVDNGRVLALFDGKRTLYRFALP